MRYSPPSWIRALGMSNLSSSCETEAAATNACQYQSVGDQGARSVVEVRRAFVHGCDGFAGDFDGDVGVADMVVVVA